MRPIFSNKFHHLRPRWVPLPGNVVAATESLIQEHNPGWARGGTTGIHAAWLADAAGAGFRDPETFSFDRAVRYSHQAWRGRIRASAGVGASLPADAVARFDRALASILAERFPADPIEVPHRVFALEHFPTRLNHLTGMILCRGQARFAWRCGGHRQRSATPPRRKKHPAFGGADRSSGCPVESGRRSPDAQASRFAPRLPGKPIRSHQIESIWSERTLADRPAERSWMRLI